MRRRPIVPVAVAFITAAACSGSDSTVTPATSQAATTTSTTEAVETAATDGIVDLDCLPLGTSGWVRSEDPLPMDGPVMLASNGDVVVAAPPVGTQLNLHVSEDGLTWSPVASVPDVALGQSEHAVAAGPYGFIAVAATGEGDLPHTPVVVHSRNGMSWEQVAPEALPAAEVAWLSDVFAGPAGFVIAGHTVDLDLLVWSSEDGRNWSETDLPLLASGSIAVTATPSGWAALTLEFDDSGSQVRVWTSRDGQHWTEIETEGVLPEVALPSYMWTAPLMWIDGRWVLVQRAGPRFPMVWVSNDGGVTWTEHGVGGDFPSNGFAIEDVTVTDFGVVLAGFQDRRSERSQYFLHHSDDGVSWRQCWVTPHEFTAISTVGDRFMAHDENTGHVYTWNES